MKMIGGLAKDRGKELQRMPAFGETDRWLPTPKVLADQHFHLSPSFFLLLPFDITTESLLLCPLLPDL